MDINISKLSHHEQQELCSSRPSYRQGRKLTAVKVYTVCDESTHLLVSRVPAIQLHAELSGLCSRFGTVTCCVLVPNYDDEEEFQETYHVQYERLQSARFAKRQLDGRSFYGGVLHVCYAPELETVKETRAKLVIRRKEVASRVRKRAKNHADDGLKTLNNAGDLSKFPQSQAVPECSTFHGVFPAQLPQQAQDVPTSHNGINSFIPPSGPVQHHQPETTQIFMGQIQNPFASYQGQANNLSEQAEPSLQTSTKKYMGQVQNSAEGYQEMTNRYVTHPVPSKPSSQTSTLRFIPRQVAVSKRIVFHKKS